ncbi:MAG: hypothetical protein JRI23_14365 [Deltaproteobacteria bacterium]|jgi:hypothetical protein|nr:hypothetical protein [Deltaproteobacteria bacterium]MBW2532929.1 hypothetical protein [Deltaproteobacteria bacterium]
MAALVILPLMLLACSKTTILRQAEPNPLVGTPHYAVLPLDFEESSVAGLTEREYLAAEEPESRDSFEGDKQAMSDAFGRSLASVEGLAVSNAQQELDEFRLVPRVVSLEPGQWGGAQPAETTIAVAVETPEGQLLDIIEVEADSGDDSILSLSPVMKLVTNARTGDRGRRMAVAAERAAQLVAEYLTERQQGK